MRRSLLLLICILAAASCAAPAQGRPVIAKDALVVWNGTLVDGSGGPPVADAVVVIADGKVVAAGPRQDVAAPEGGRWLDAGGGTIMPGVIDAHAHLEATLDAGQDVLTPWLQSGVTTIEDAGVVNDGGIADLRARVAAIPGAPRVQLAGPILSAPGGYPAGRVYAAIGREVASPAEARAAVDELTEEDGVDVIKIAIERGFRADYGDQGWPVLTPREVSAIVDEAHAHGRPVYAHLTGPDELAVAMDAGVDVAAHTPVTPVPDDLLREAAARGVIMITTIGCWNAEGPGYADQAAANAARFYQLGGRLAIGTDYPFAANAMPMTEFEYLAQAGVPNPALLMAATRNGAAAIGRGGDLGTLERGKVADLIVVAGDPLADWRALGSVTAVVRGGEVVREPVGEEVSP